MNPAALSQFVQFFTLEDQAATQRVSERLNLVLRSPESYVEQYEEELAERGIVLALPPQELRDIALIDALLMEDLAWESDWDDIAPNIAEGLNAILTRQKRTHALQPTALTGRREPGPEQARHRAGRPGESWAGPGAVHPRQRLLPIGNSGRSPRGAGAQPGQGAGLRAWWFIKPGRAAEPLRR
ncbi:hypothetical protein ACFQT0_24530 [Hymenobacter humi]|uniref:DUF6630 domain-containing protein n=1 Tax=Hymenobacter humi TaxID=1411620 RepID=A0ABW2UCL5_9BACT